MNELVCINQIRAYGSKHYDQGWGVVMDNWLDGDILEFLSENDFDLRRTILAIQDWINMPDSFTGGSEYNPDNFRSLD